MCSLLADRRQLWYLAFLSDDNYSMFPLLVGLGTAGM
jgi:hypothetical protein